MCAWQIDKRKGVQVVRLADKEKKLAHYQAALEKAKIAVVAEYRGLSVAQLATLREALFPQGAEFTVIKNTLAKLALKGTDGEALVEMLQGPNALLLGYEDEVQPTKTLKEFLQKAKIGEIKGGVMAGQLLSRSEVLELAELPSLDELRAKLLGAINSPLVGTVRAIGSQQQALVTVLEQYAKTKESA